MQAIWSSQESLSFNHTDSTRFLHVGYYAVSDLTPGGGAPNQIQDGGRSFSMTKLFKVFMDCEAGYALTASWCGSFHINGAYIRSNCGIWPVCWRTAFVNVIQTFVFRVNPAIPRPGCSCGTGLYFRDK